MTRREADLVVRARELAQRIWSNEPDKISDSKAAAASAPAVGLSALERAAIILHPAADRVSDLGEVEETLGAAVAVLVEQSRTTLSLPRDAWRTRATQQLLALSGENGSVVVTAGTVEAWQIFNLRRLRDRLWAGALSPPDETWYLSVVENGYRMAFRKNADPRGPRTLARIAKAIRDVKGPV